MNARDEIGDQLVGRNHRLAVESVNDLVEPVTKRRVPLEGDLETRSASVPLETTGGKGVRRTFLLSSWFNIRTSSSNTSDAHLSEGSSIRLICCLMMTSKAVVPTKSAGEEPCIRWQLSYQTDRLSTAELTEEL